MTILQLSIIQRANFFPEIPPTVWRDNEGCWLLVAATVNECVYTPEVAICAEETDQNRERKMRPNVSVPMFPPRTPSAHSFEILESFESKIVQKEDSSGNCSNLSWKSHSMFGIHTVGSTIVQRGASFQSPTLTSDQVFFAINWRVKKYTEIILFNKPRQLYYCICFHFETFASTLFLKRQYVTSLLIYRNLLICFLENFPVQISLRKSFSWSVSVSHCSCVTHSGVFILSQNIKKGVSVKK